MTPSWRTGLLWCALVVSFSPVLRNLFENLRDNPHQRYTLLPLLLMALLFRAPARPPKPASRAGGGIVLGLGLAALLLGIAGGSWGLSRLGLPLAMWGLARRTGWPAARPLLLAFAVVPVPTFIEVATSPYVETRLAAFSESVLGVLGASIDARGPVLRAPGRHLELLPRDNGVVAALVVAVTIASVGIRREQRASTVGLHAIGGACLALVAWPGFVLVGVAGLWLGRPDCGRFLLTHGPWIIAIPVAIAWHARLDRAARRRPPVESTGAG